VDKSNEILINNLKAEMKRLNWEYEDVAKASGLTRSGIYKIVKGQRWPGADNLDRLTNAFKRPHGWLLQDHTSVVPQAPQKQTREQLLLTLFEEALKLDDDGLSLVLETIRVRAKRGKSESMSGLKNTK
jgi:transcriptional regulator with XRE-family HTH domain